MNIEGKMNAAWQVMRHKLFLEKTNLVYDSLSSHDHDHRFDHLPYPEEIRQHLPNPAGWGTGMEDSMLNSGSVLEVCIIRARHKPDDREDILNFARKIIKGMDACATIHGKPGFVARSISPRDGHSCYINSSRDQFTLFVYGMWRFFHSKLADDSDRKRMIQNLKSVSDYMEDAVKEENENNHLRLDGKPGMVSQMIDTAPHEEFRLPMLHIAAWDVSRETIYLERYRRYASHALDITLSMDKSKNWWNLELVQMQISLAVARAAETDGQMLKKINRAMYMTAELAESSFYREEPKMLNFGGIWSQTADPWYNAWKMTLRPESIHTDGPCLYHGLFYLKPWENQNFMDAFEIMRAIGNLAIAVALCPDYKPASDFYERFERAASVPEYEKHTSGGVCNILHGYYLLRQKNDS